MPAKPAQTAQAETKVYAIDSILGMLTAALDAYDVEAHKVIKEGAKPGEFIQVMFNLSPRHNSLDFLEDGSAFNYAWETIAAKLNCSLGGTVLSFHTRQVGFNLLPYGRTDDYLGRNKRAAVRRSLPEMVKQIECQLARDKHRR